MTVREEQGWSEVLSLNRLPEHITGKRVTELMDLSGEKTFVTGAGGDGSA
jgi:3-oxoacyl-[acyl-carrier protein] reductase